MESQNVTSKLAVTPDADLKQTREFADALFGTIAQGVISFKDGVQITDILQFVDEAELWKKGIEGFATNFRGEAVSSDPAIIETVFNPQYDKLVAAGVKPMLAYAIVNGVKAIFTTYAVAAASGQAVVVN
jgi:hypothetical protein